MHMARSLILRSWVCVGGVAGWETSPGTETPANNPTATTPAKDDAAAMRQEIEQLKQTLAALETRLEVQEKQKPEQVAPTKELEAKVDELDTRVSKTEVKSALDRLNFSGDYRFEAHTIFGNVPAHYAGMQLKNLVMKSLFAVTILVRIQTREVKIDNTVVTQYGAYQQFTNNLTFD